MIPDGVTYFTMGTSTIQSSLLAYIILLNILIVIALRFFFDCSSFRRTIFFVKSEGQIPQASHESNKSTFPRLCPRRYLRLQHTTGCTAFSIGCYSLSSTPHLLLLLLCFVNIRRESHRFRQHATITIQNKATTLIEMTSVWIHCKRPTKSATNQVQAFDLIRDGKNISSNTDRWNLRRMYNLRSPAGGLAHRWAELIFYLRRLVCVPRPLAVSVFAGVGCNNRWIKLGLRHLILGLITPLTSWINRSWKSYRLKLLVDSWGRPLYYMYKIWLAVRSSASSSHLCWKQNVKSVVSLRIMSYFW